MSKIQRQSFLHGAVILAGAIIVVKLIGAFFKIPLGNILGNVGMGYFSTAYNIFIPIYTLAMAGFPAAVSRMVSEASVNNQYRDVTQILKVSTQFFLITGIIGSGIIGLFSNIFAINFADQNSIYSIIAISPAVLFGCVMSGFRGYYEGLRNMKPTAVSQIIESIVKLIAGLGLSLFIIQVGNNQYETSKIVFGRAVESYDQASLIILPFAAAGAIFGVTLSTLFGMIYLIIKYKKNGRNISISEFKSSPKAESKRTIFVTLIKIAIPISVGALVLNLTSLIDLVTIMNKLQELVDTNLSGLLKAFDGIIPSEIVESNQIPNYLWGAYGGLAVSIFNIVPAFTGILAKSALPNVSAAWSMGNKKEVKANIESVTRITCIFAIPAGVGIFVMSEPILRLVYSAQINDAMIASKSLSVMGIGVIFLGMITPIFSILQAIGKQYLPVIFMLIGAIIKYIVNSLTVGIAELNIVGAAIGTLSCYGVIFLLSLIFMIKESNVKINIFNSFIKPLIAAIFCGVAVYASYGILSNILGSTISLIISVGLSVIVYILVLFLIKGILKTDIAMLPKTEKIIKILEKRNLI